MQRQSTTAFPLALAYLALIVYASLYPFGPWRDQGIAPWAFLAAPLPRYWTGFDLLSNVLGYAPLGLLLALGWIGGVQGRHPVLAATALAAGLSLGMESLQSYLPLRVPSHVDLGLNALGAWLGALLAWALDALGWVQRWTRWRQRWLSGDATGNLALLALWPVGLLFPAAVPFGLGQVLPRLLAVWPSYFPAWDGWPLGALSLHPLAALTEITCVLLGALAPCLLAYCVVRTFYGRCCVALGVLLAGVAASALSAALSYGPAHAWAWLGPGVQQGLVGAALLALLLAGLGSRVIAGLGLLAVLWQLVLLNQAPTSPYFAQTLQTWEQGRFIRFQGVVQWLGWLWPYVAAGWLARRLLRRSAPELAP